MGDVPDDNQNKTSYFMRNIKAPTKSPQIANRAHTYYVQTYWFIADSLIISKTLRDDVPPASCVKHDIFEPFCR